MHAFHFQKKLSLLLGLCLLLAGLGAVALAESAVPVPEIGIRYYATENELCLTRSDLPEEGLRWFGMDAAAMRAAMENGQLFLVSLYRSGGQVSLRCFEKPEGISGENSFALTPAEKESFLILLARQGQFHSAEWVADAPGFALFSTYREGEALAPATVHTLSVSTLFQNRIYALQTDIINRPPNESDIALLLSAVERTLFLGDVAESAGHQEDVTPLTLPPLSPLTEKNAAFTKELSGIPLTLAPIPEIVGTTTLLLTGTTDAGVSMRYSLNGKASSRFKAGADGSFSVSIKGLETEGDNQVELTAFTTQEASVIRFTVSVQWQQTPLMLSQTSGDVQEDSVALNGVTLPGAKVQLIRRTGTNTIPLREDGSFTVAVSTKKLGENAFTIRALAPGYRREDTLVTLVRKFSPEEEVKALQKKVKAISYEALTQNPAAYRDQPVEYQGTVVTLANTNGQPLFLLDLGNGQYVLCLCDDLAAVDIGQSLHIVGTLLGEIHPLQTRHAEGNYPALRLNAMIP